MKKTRFAAILLLGGLHLVSAPLTAPLMDYISTRGSAPALDFAGATLAGLANDGGLYLPRDWPRFSNVEIAGMAGLPYAELAARIMQPFVEGSLMGAAGTLLAKASSTLTLVDRAKVEAASKAALGAGT